MKLNSPKQIAFVTFVVVLFVNLVSVFLASTMSPFSQGYFGTISGPSGFMARVVDEEGGKKIPTLAKLALVFLQEGDKARAVRALEAIQDPSIQAYSVSLITSTILGSEPDKEKVLQSAAFLNLITPEKVKGPSYLAIAKAQKGLGDEKAAEIGFEKSFEAERLLEGTYFSMLWTFLWQCVLKFIESVIVALIIWFFLRIWIQIEPVLNPDPMISRLPGGNTPSK